MSNDVPGWWEYLAKKPSSEERARIAKDAVATIRRWRMEVENVGEAKTLTWFTVIKHLNLPSPPEFYEKHITRNKSQRWSWSMF